MPRDKGDETPMTPIEKKAREIFGSVLHHTVEEELWRIGDAIEVAERRGFERARNLAISWFANNGYEALKQELENLKYEEGA